jgi:signal peptide peptidase SppA
MNITKHYPMIMRELYSRPWLITPAAHNALVKGFEAHLKSGQVNIPDMPMEPDGDDPMAPEIPDMENGIAIISVDGVIGKHLGMMEQCMGGCDIENITSQLRAAAENANVAKIVLYINSPGGSVTGIPELYQLISEITKTKDVIAFTDTVCASGAMYLASACTAIFCAPSSDLGSVGVYSIYVDESRAIEDAKITVNAISAGTMKLAGASFMVMSPEVRAMFQADIDRIYNQFKTDVLKKRTIADTDLQGGCYDGVTAVIKGFADGNINDMEQLLMFLTQ